MPFLPDKVLTFILDEGRFALDAQSVHQVLQAVATSPLPNAPSIVIGTMNCHSRILPVISLRRRFELPDTPIAPHHYLIIAQTPHRTVALLVDGIGEVIPCPAEQFRPIEEILPRLRHLTGILASPNGSILIHDLASLLSLEEEAQLDEALTA